jgi:omega-6 fatty acid desaturase (delta-12 desaturase)
MRRSSKEEGQVQASGMRTGSELLRATKTFASEDSRSWWHLWSTLAVVLTCWAVACFDTHWLIRLPCSVLLGLVLVRMFVIYHDYQHGAILRGSRVADAVMLVFGLIILNPPRIWNRTHNHHHKHNAKDLTGIGSFPLMTTEDYAKAGRLERFGYVAIRHPLTIALGYFTVFLYGMCLRSLLVNPREHFDSCIALMLHIAMVILLAVFAPDLLIFAILLPGMVAAALGAYLFYAQHNFPGLKLQARDDWDYVFAALHSSSFIAMSPVMHWFTANIGYHHIHHLNAKIPFYRLPEAMAAFEELQSPGRTSLSPRDIFRCLRLKLWDSETNRLVTFKEHAAKARSSPVVPARARDRVHPRDRRPRLSVGGSFTSNQL